MATVFTTGNWQVLDLVGVDRDGVVVVEYIDPRIIDERNALAWPLEKIMESYE
ncbi:MAG: hypothetical protein KDD43_00465 [Bdellovibrionales bacterium]|nr:hypothetical protein [Bdellovibrionales bacterium]